MENFGQYLRAHREKKGIRLEEIASITKIHLHSLQHLESSHWNELPPEPFIRGFIIAYAKYVGLDPKETIEQYVLEIGGTTADAIPEPEEITVVTTEFKKPPKREKREEPSVHAKENPSDIIENSKPFPGRQIFIGFSALVIFGIAVGVTFVGKRSKEPDTSVAVSAKPAETAPLVNPPEAAKPETQVAPPVVAENPSNSSGSVRAPATQEKSGTSESPSVPSITQNSAPQALVTTPAPAAEPAKDPSIKHELVIQGKERTWMKIVVDGGTPVETYLKAGEQVTYSAKEKIKLVLGNSTGTEVLHNGEKAEGKRYQGTIRYYVFPKNARFPQDPPKQRATASSPDSTSGEKPAEATQSNDLPQVPSEEHPPTTDDTKSE